MFGERKLSAIKKDFVKLMETVPADSPEDWFDREIEEAMKQPGRDVEALRSLKRFLAEAKKVAVPSKSKAKSGVKKKRRLASSH